MSNEITKFLADSRELLANSGVFVDDAARLRFQLKRACELIESQEETVRELRSDVNDLRDQAETSYDRGREQGMADQRESQL